MQKYQSFFIVFALLICAQYNLCQPQGDLVDITAFNATITAWKIPYTGQMYAGQLEVNAAQSVYYWFFPHQEQPENMPLLLWLNGGPGCSSMLGATTENGPFLFNSDGSALEYNPYAWTNDANVLYFESPPGVGFSQTTNYNYSNDLVAQINLEALIQFFQEFPAFMNNSFYISGESYGGIYVPTLAYAIHMYNQQPHNGTGNQTINLKGFIFGNGCVSKDECVNEVQPFKEQFLYEMGYITDQQYWNFSYQCANQPSVNVSKGCEEAIGDIDQVTYGAGLNPYNVLQYCTYNGGNSTLFHDIYGQRRNYRKQKQQNRNLQQQNEEENLKLTPDCTDATGPDNFFNNAQVQNFLHVSATNATLNWTMCNEQILNNFNRQNGSYDAIKFLVQQDMYTIWVYSGDVDSAVPITGTLAWIMQLRSEFGLIDIEPWQPWIQQYNESIAQNAGSFWSMDGLTFVSFKGSGHMVPTDDPDGAQIMLNKFFYNGQMPYN